MSELKQQTLRQHILQAENTLFALSSQDGKVSLAYGQALRRFIRIWSVMKMTRNPDEFLKEVSHAQNS